MALPSSQAQLPALTGLRFVAAFAVLLLHYRDLLGPMPGALQRAIVGGQYGVSFFFILSGFILTYRYRDWFSHGVEEGNFWRFLRYRVARIYPVYVLGLLLDTPWRLLERVLSGQWSEVGATWWASWLLNAVGLQAWVPAVPFAMFWNTPAWSVAAEFFFYLSFPWVCAWVMGRPRSLASLVGWMVAAVLGSTVLQAVVVHTLTYRLHVDTTTLYLVTAYNPLLRYGEFFSGCLAGAIFLQLQARPLAFGRDDVRGRRLRDTMVAAALVLSLVRIMMPDYTGPESWRWVLDLAMKYSVFILPFSLLIIAVATGRTCLSGWLAQPWMQQLGEASYALYIIHWSVISFLRLGLLGAADTPLVHALFMLGSVGAALLCHRWVELPWRRRLRGAAPEAPATVAPAAAPAIESAPPPTPALTPPLPSA